jgi:hypothetical protein
MRAIVIKHIEDLERETDKLYRLHSSYVDVPKVCIYKVVAIASGMGARNKFYLVWHLCTNHGAHIFT